MATLTTITIYCLNVRKIKGQKRRKVVSKIEGFFKKLSSKEAVAKYNDHINFEDTNLCGMLEGG